MHRVLRDLHPEIAEYKGMPRYRQIIVDYLAPSMTARQPRPGTAPEQIAL